MENFKLGDRVITTSNSEYPEAGLCGTIVGLHKSGSPDYIMLLDCKNPCAHTASSFAREYNLAEDFPPIDEREDRCVYVKNTEIAMLDKEDKKIIIYMQGNKVTAKCLINKNFICEGTAECASADVFEFAKGAQIALQRCLDKTNNKPIFVDYKLLARHDLIIVPNNA